MILLIVISTFSLAYCQTQDIISGNNLFTVSIYKEIAKKEKGNILVSPFSAETILALTQSGAKDASGTEIRKALHLPDDQQKIESGFKELMSSLQSSQDYTLKSAKKLYIKNEFQIKDDFKKAATESFSATTENIDFTQKDQAVKTINSWVEKNTENNIHDLISSENLKDTIRLLLIDALYFQGNWSMPFSRLSTSKRNFYKTKTEIVRVDTMRSIAQYNYFQCGYLDAKFLEISFKGRNVSMTFILPNKVDGLSNLESKLDSVFQPHNYAKTFVSVSLPKFKIEQKFNFKENLQSLGVNQAFTQNQADLSGIAGQKGDLVIDEVLQKTFINVTETGVDAAGATSVGVTGAAAPSSRQIIPIPTTFTADHPFIFHIDVKGLIIFAGRVVSPSV